MKDYLDNTNKVKRILLISPGELPVPAIKGGAVETLMDLLITENEHQRAFRLDVLSVWEKNRNPVRLHMGRHICFYPSKKAVLMDKAVFFYWEKIKKDWRAMFYRNHFCKQEYAQIIYEHLKVNQYDRIIVENNVSLLIPVYQALGHRRFSQICDFHMHSILIEQPDVIPLLRRCHSLIAVSQFVAQRVPQIYSELQHLPVEVLLNTIDEQHFRINRKTHNALKAGLYSSTKETIFLYAGRISVEKGVKELVTAFMCCARKDWQLVIAGGSFSDENKMSQYEKEVRALCLESKLNIRFLGYVPNQQMYKLYTLADVLVIPSLVEEAGSLTAIEGYAMGIPMITARIGSLPEYLGEYPLYVDPGDGFADRLADALKQYELAIANSEKTAGRKKYGKKEYFDSFRKIVLNQ